MNGHPDRDKKLAAVAAAHDDWAQAHAGDAVFDPERAKRKPGSDYNQHYLDVNPPPGAEEDFHRRIRQPASDAPGTITEQAALPVAAVPVTPVPLVPDNPGAVAMFTAHRLDDGMHDLAHAAQRMTAAREAGGDGMRAYHSAHLAQHLASALDAGHDLAANVRAHYPAEAAELEAVKESVGLAKAVSDDAKAATTAHLLETTLHEETHGSRHALAMLEPGSDAEWAFNADHCAKHLGGAVEHAGKLRQHFADNYPAEARWLAGLGQDASGGEDGKPQHAGYAKGTVTAQMAQESYEEPVASQIRATLDYITDRYGTITAQAAHLDTWSTAGYPDSEAG